MDVRDHTAASDGRLNERIKLFVTTNSELQVAWRDTLHLKVLARIACKLEHLGGEVLQDGGRVDRRGGADAALGRHAQLEVAVDPESGCFEKRKWEK